MQAPTSTNVSFVRANVIGTAMLLLFFVLVFAPYAALWGSDELVNAVGTAFDANTILILTILILSVVAHELLHGVGFRMAGVPWREVRFGVYWKFLTPFATTSSMITARDYRVATALPGIVLGALPAIAGIAVGNGAVAFYGAFMLGAAGGDAVVLWSTRHLAGNTIVRDCMHAVGCEVVEPVTAS